MPSVPVVARGNADPRVGTVIGNQWRLDAVIGQGRLTNVYAATNPQGLRAAVRVLARAGAQTPHVKGTFVRHAYRANHVHPEVVAVREDGAVEGGIPFIVGELVEGETLAAHLARLGGRMKVGAALSISRDLLEVLVSCHKKPLLHGDLHPRSLLLSTDGSLRLTGLGLDGHVIQRRRPGSENEAFNSPEQRSGHAGEVSASSDVYAVGALLVYMISGRAPVVSSASRPSNPLPSAPFPESVEALVSRALHRERSQRFQSAESMLQAVRETIHELRFAPP